MEMPSLGLSIDELFDYTEEERRKWRDWLSSRPEALEVKFQHDGRFPTVASMIDHIFIVDVRHLQRLRRESPLADRTNVNPADLAGLFAFGDAARADLRAFVAALESSDAATARQIKLADREFRMTPRKLLFHILIHETRHWAQVALALRNAGYDLPGDHDLFFTKALE